MGQKQSPQVAVTTGFSEMAWEMTETIEMIFRDTMLPFGPAPVGQALTALPEAQIMAEAIWLASAREEEGDFIAERIKAFLS